MVETLLPPEVLHIHAPCLSVLYADPTRSKGALGQWESDGAVHASHEVLC